MTSLGAGLTCTRMQAVHPHLRRAQAQVQVSPSRHPRLIAPYDTLAGGLLFPLLAVAAVRWEPTDFRCLIDFGSQRPIPGR